MPVQMKRIWEDYSRGSVHRALQARPRWPHFATEWGRSSPYDWRAISSLEELGDTYEILASSLLLGSSSVPKPRNTQDRRAEIPCTRLFRPRSAGHASAGWPFSVFPCQLFASHSPFDLRPRVSRSRKSIPASASARESAPAFAEAHCSAARSRFVVRAGDHQTTIFMRDCTYF
jgi:hypothetical protein